MMTKATALRSALRNYVDMLCTRTPAGAYTDNKFTTYIQIHYHMLLGYERAGVSGAWFIAKAHERQKQYEHAIFDISCVVFDSTYEYKSAMYRCIGKAYMI